MFTGEALATDTTFEVGDNVESVVISALVAVAIIVLGKAGINALKGLGIHFINKKIEQERDRDY